MYLDHVRTTNKCKYNISISLYLQYIQTLSLKVASLFPHGCQYGYYGDPKKEYHCTPRQIKNCISRVITHLPTRNPKEPHLIVCRLP